MRLKTGLLIEKSPRESHPSVKLEWGNQGRAHACQERRITCTVARRDGIEILDLQQEIKKNSINKGNTPNYIVRDWFSAERQKFNMMHHRTRRLLILDPPFFFRTSSVKNSKNSYISCIIFFDSLNRPKAFQKSFSCLSQSIRYLQLYKDNYPHACKAKFCYIQRS